MALGQGEGVQFVHVGKGSENRGFFDSGWFKRFVS